MKKSRLLPGKKCKECAGHGCSVCSNRGFIVKTAKARPKVRPVKEKRIQENITYAELRRLFLVEHPRCLVPTGPGKTCGKRSTECHHRKGRGKFYLDVSTFFPCCSACHQAIHTTRQLWARKMALLVNPSSTAPCPPVSQVFLPYEPSNPT